MNRATPLENSDYEWENLPLPAFVLAKVKSHKIMAITLSRPFIFMSPRIMNNCKWSTHKLNVREGQKKGGLRPGAGSEERDGGHIVSRHVRKSILTFSADIMKNRIRMPGVSSAIPSRIEANLQTHPPTHTTTPFAGCVDSSLGS